MKRRCQSGTCGNEFDSLGATSLLCPTCAAFEASRTKKVEESQARCRCRRELNEWCSHCSGPQLSVLQAQQVLDRAAQKAWEDRVLEAAREVQTQAERFEVLMKQAAEAKAAWEVAGGRLIEAASGNPLASAASAQPRPAPSEPPDPSGRAA